MSDKPNTQQPVAWRHKVVEPDGSEGVMFSRGKDCPWVHWKDAYKAGCVFTVQPLYTAPPVPRDVLVKALDDMMYHCACQWSNSDPDKMVELCRDDIERIADCYASKVQPEHVPLTAAGSEDQAIYASIAANYHQPEPVNQQGMRKKFEEWAPAKGYDIRPSRIGLPFADGFTNSAWEIWQAAIAAAEEAQPVVNGEILGETCIDGGKCHHKCADQCFRRQCCEPFSDYTGPWGYDAPQPASAQPVAVPDGYVLVPVTPTKAMTDAMRAFVRGGWSDTEHGRRPMSALYADMLSASQKGGAA